MMMKATTDLKDKEMYPPKRFSIIQDRPPKQCLVDWSSLLKTPRQIPLEEGPSSWRIKYAKSGDKHSSHCPTIELMAR